jgi:hypothetical protein
LGSRPAFVPEYAWLSRYFVLCFVKICIDSGRGEILRLKDQSVAMIRVDLMSD